MKNLLFICFILSGFFATAQNDLDKLLARKNSHSIPYISVEELKMRKKDGNLVILDAREPEEFKVSRIKTAQFAGYNNFSVEKISHLIKDRSTLVVVYCSLGIRSENISEKLTKEAYTNIRNLYGGIFKWKNKGYSVYNSEGLKTEKVHAYSKAWSKWLKNAEKVF